MAEALGPRISRRHDTQEAETASSFREDRWRQNLPDRHRQSRQEQKEPGGAKGLIACRRRRLMMPLSRLRSGACPISAFSKPGIAGRRCSAIPRPNACAGIFWRWPWRIKSRSRPMVTYRPRPKRRLREIADAVHNGEANAMLG